MTQEAEALALYVYYKLAPAQAQAAKHALAQLKLESKEVGLQLLQRADSGDELLTWMEIYQGPVEAMLSLEAQVAAALRPFIQGARHLERFQPFALPSLTAT